MDYNEGDVPVVDDIQNIANRLGRVQGACYKLQETMARVDYYILAHGHAPDEGELSKEYFREALQGAWEEVNALKKTIENETYLAGMLIGTVDSASGGIIVKKSQAG